MCENFGTTELAVLECLKYTPIYLYDALGGGGGGNGVPTLSSLFSYLLGLRRAIVALWATFLWLPLGLPYNYFGHSDVVLSPFRNIVGHFSIIFFYLGILDMTLNMG